MTKIQNLWTKPNIVRPIFMLLILGPALSAQNLSPDQEIPMTTPGDSADFAQIKQIFFQQEKDWNRGDIEAFMEAYWISDQLQFGGANGITRGWEQTLERYRKGYPDQAAMGQLSFQIKDMTRHSESVVSLTGSWELTREGDRPGGHFLLIWRKIDGDWKIVVDHTSQRLPD